MKKVLFVATVVQKHIMEFHIPYLKMFKEMGWETAVAARNDYENPEECVIPYCDKYYNLPIERFPIKSDNYKSFKELKRIINSQYYNIVHCHTPVGAMLARLAAKEARKSATKVIYTAHGFHFYTGAPLFNWLIYYPVEWWLAYETDVLITINKEDYERAKKFKAGKVVYIPGIGIDLKRIKSINTERDKIRKQLGLNESDYVLLSVGELIKRKNHRVVLEAIGRLKELPIYKDIHYLICGNGELKESLQNLTHNLGIEEHVHFLGYRQDVIDICNASDTFVFMSYQEGLPVALMEAMACGCPIICTKIRGNIDIINDGQDGVFASNDPDDVSKKIMYFFERPDERNLLGTRAKERVKEFDIAIVEKKMLEIYEF